MGTALFTGVAGLQVHQRRLDVIGNNIANVNTTAFRGSRALFQEMISQTWQGASAPSTTNGGSNPMQIGLGVSMGTVDSNFTQGSLQTTGFASDLAIQGRGFFILSNDPTGQANFYTRDGSFQLNADGELIDPATGLRVQGYLVDPTTGEIDIDGGLQDLVVPVGGAAVVQATSSVELLGNLSSDAAAADTVERSVRVFDSLGTVRDIRITFTKTANPNEWTWAASSTDPDISAITGTGTIQFGADGTFTSATSTNISVTFGAGPSVPTSPFAFDLDFADVTQLSDLSDVVVANQDGLGRGVLEAYNVGQDGTVQGVYSNGLTRTIGQVALANFSNESGLLRNGNNLFTPTSNSGLAQVGPPETGGRGEIAGGTLEASNVDLGTEFANLILTQRGFQANARTITAADTLLQETVNLVR